MRKGKIAAQAAHASMAVLLNYGGYVYAPHAGVSEFRLNLSNPAIAEWLAGAFTKVCVYVNSEQELLDIVAKAKEAGVLNALITDSGLTEFNGVPTNTCCAIGPDFPERINPITGHLPLL